MSSRGKGFHINPGSLLYTKSVKMRVPRLKRTVGHGPNFDSDTFLLIRSIVIRGLIEDFLHTTKKKIFTIFNFCF